MAKPDLLWRRQILSASLADLIELEELVYAAKEYGGGYLSTLEPALISDEVKRITTRLVTTQMEIEAKDLD